MACDACNFSLGIIKHVFVVMDGFMDVQEDSDPNFAISLLV